MLLGLRSLKMRLIGNGRRLSESKAFTNIPLRRHSTGQGMEAGVGAVIRGRWVERALTPNEDIDAGGGGAVDDGLDVLVEAAVVAGVITAGARQHQVLAVRPARLALALPHLDGAVPRRLRSPWLLLPV